MRSRKKQIVKYGANANLDTVPLTEKSASIQNGFQDEISTEKDTTDENLVGEVQELKLSKSDNAAIDGDNLAKTSTSKTEVRYRDKSVHLSRHKCNNISRLHNLYLLAYLLLISCILA